MYTQIQRSVATTLLFSLLLQGCASPSLKIADDTLPKIAGTKINHPAKVTQCIVLASGAKSAEDSMKPKVGCALVLGDEALSKGSTEALAEVPSKASNALAGELSYILHDDCSSTPSPSPLVNVVSQRPAISSPFRSSNATNERKQSVEKKTQHVALDKDAIARRKGTPLDGSLAVPVVVTKTTQPQVLQLTSFLHAESLYPVFSLHPKLQHALKAAEHKEAHLNPAINPTLYPYPSAQGNQVRFQEVGGNWACPGTGWMGPCAVASGRLCTRPKPYTGPTKASQQS